MHIEVKFLQLQNRIPNVISDQMNKLYITQVNMFKRIGFELSSACYNESMYLVLGFVCKSYNENRTLSVGV